jgi:hypothetical protein
VKRILLLTIAVGALVPMMSPAAGVQPIVIIVLADDLGWGDLSCYGGKLAQTPSLDRMAKEGIRFTQGYVASPVCSPSRCGIITGQFPGRWRSVARMGAPPSVGNQGMVSIGSHRDWGCVVGPPTPREGAATTATDSSYTRERGSPCGPQASGPLIRLAPIREQQ